MTSGKAKASHWTLNFPGWEVPHPVSSQQSGLGHKRLREHTSAACLVATQRSYGSGVHRPCPLLFALPFFFFFLSFFFFLTLDAIALQRMGRPSSCVLDAWDKSPILTQDTLGPQVAVERLAAWKSPGCHRCLVAPETLNNQSLHIRANCLTSVRNPVRYSGPPWSFHSCMSMNCSSGVADKSDTAKLCSPQSHSAKPDSRTNCITTIQ